MCMGGESEPTEHMEPTELSEDARLSEHSEFSEHSESAKLSEGAWFSEFSENSDSPVSGVQFYGATAEGRPPLPGRVLVPAPGTFPGVIITPGVTVGRCTGPTPGLYGGLGRGRHAGRFQP